ncbi:helix-turn-helix domain-containing protein [Mesorhizobium sp. 1M-11]|uniref:helix-turn-helix domain-containing protein n=1 Tax=Mesorhizobium sp. 1M-11 TaxID=1529006 RepID=UPI0006C739D1|nr:helix-turn-helix domain-containing protein [Mesorhizobium sp. 1M-11]
MNDTKSSRLAERLLLALRPLALDPARPQKQPGMHPHGRQLFSYCCFAAERLARISNEKPLIGVVLSGSKEIWLGDAGQRFEAGDVFVFPHGRAFDVVNVPAETSGIYESLIVEVDHVPESVRRLGRPPRAPALGLDLRVPLTEDLVAALSHAAPVLAASGHAAMLAEHRLAEVLLLLRNVPAAAWLFEVSLPERVALLVASAPARRWTAELLGQALGVGASTLRRQLAGEGTSLRAVLSATRMQLAHDVLARGEGNVTAAVSAAGYASRSHFGRQFRGLYGASPSVVRQQGSTEQSR